VRVTAVNSSVETHRREGCGRWVGCAAMACSSPTRAMGGVCCDGMQFTHQSDGREGCGRWVGCAAMACSSPTRAMGERDVDGGWGSSGVCCDGMQCTHQSDGKVEFECAKNAFVDNDNRCDGCNVERRIQQRDDVLQDLSLQDVCRRREAATRVSRVRAVDGVAGCAKALSLPEHIPHTPQFTHPPTHPPTHPHPHIHTAQTQPRQRTDTHAHASRKDAGRERGNAAR
jgi:hypothetical protein